MNKIKIPSHNWSWDFKTFTENTGRTFNLQYLCLHFTKWWL